MKQNDYSLRPEAEADYRETEALVRESFWNVYRPGCTEHYILHILRDDPAYLPELALVMEKDGRLIGQTAYVQSTLCADDGRRVPILTLGPIGILPGFQRRAMAEFCWRLRWKRRRRSAGAPFVWRGTYGSTGKADLSVRRNTAFAIAACPTARTTRSFFSRR